MLALGITNEVWASPSLKLHLLLVLCKFILIGFTKLITSAGEIVLCIATFGGPLLILVTVLSCNLYLLLKPFLMSTILLRSYAEEFSKARAEMCRFWLLHGELYHRFNVDGFEKIPERGGAVIVYYHAAIPIDYIYLASKLMLKRKRLIRSIVDKYVIWIPGFEMLAAGFGCFAGTRESCIKLLKEGRLIGIAPGGGYEAQCGSRDYDVLWKKRAGFAKIAHEAQVPIIPVFTENIRETVINMQTGLGWWRRVYNTTRIPMVPLYGGFPVRLTMHVGDPIYPTPDITVEELRQQVLQSMEDLIAIHQETPGDIVRAVSQRIENESCYFERKYLRYATRIRLNSEMECSSVDPDDHYRTGFNSEDDSEHESSKVSFGGEEAYNEIFDDESDMIWMKERQMELPGQSDPEDQGEVTVMSHLTMESHLNPALMKSDIKLSSEDQSSSGFESMSVSDSESTNS